MHVSANAFYSKIEDYQLPNFFGGFLDRIVNVEEVRNFGLEVEAKASVTDQLTISGGLGLLESEIKRGIFGGQSAAGQELPYAPSVTARVGLDYECDFGLSVGGTVAYVGAYENVVPNVSGLRSGGFTTLDLRSSFALNDQIELFAFANNLFDENYSVRALTTGAFLPGAPLTIGLGMNAQW